MTSLPDELLDHITLVSTHVWFDLLTPVKAGSTSNPFFCANDETHQVPSVERRDVAAPMPEELRVVYERYSDDTEFATESGWMFLSEVEILERSSAMASAGQSRLVDIGFIYAGMGHVTVLSYDPESGCVLTNLDGGANGYDRQDNHEKRVELCVGEATKLPFRDWWRDNQKTNEL